MFSPALMYRFVDNDTSHSWSKTADENRWRTI